MYKRNFQSRARQLFPVSFSTPPPPLNYEMCHSFQEHKKNSLATGSETVSRGTHLGMCVGRFGRVSDTPWTVARRAPPSVGSSGQGHWSGLPCPPPGDLLTQESNPNLLGQVGSQPLAPPGKPEVKLGVSGV